MKSMFVIISLFLLQISATHIPQKIKLCINCKYYKKNIFSNSEYGKCKLFVKENEDNYFLVNGITNNNKENYYCSTARSSNNMCGKDGTFYEKK